MRSERVVLLLTQASLLAGLASETIRRLAERCVERRYRKGQLVCYQGDAGDSLFVVAEGSLRVFLISEQGREMVLSILGPGDAFGELALVDGGPRSATVEVLESATLLTLGRAAFLEVLREDPALAEALLRKLGTLVRRITEQAADLSLLDLPGRVAKLILRLAEGHEVEVDGGILLDLPVTQAGLAGMVGASRQSVNQVLRSFELRGYLDLHGKSLVLKEPESLRRRAGM